MRGDARSPGRGWRSGGAALAVAALAVAAWASVPGHHHPAEPSDNPSDRNQRGEIVVQIVFDNYSFDKRLKTSWGFACVVTGLEKTILFDTGGDGPILLANMRACGIAPKQIDAVVLSHIHYDHTGGLGAFLDAHPRVTVYLPKVFPEGFKHKVRGAGATVVETDQPRQVCKGAWTTGVLDGGIPEQGLYLKGGKGLVVITGCAHPGIVDIVKAAKVHAGARPDTVMGGFHMGGASERRIRQVIERFKKMGVARVAPTHCSGDETRRQMKEAFGEGYLPAGAGARFAFEPESAP